MYRSFDSSQLKSDKGMSMVELIVVIAIIAIMLTGGGFGLMFLTGAEAREAANKTDSVLNDSKTGAMSRAGEVVVIRYIDIESESDSDKEAISKKGVSKSGFYAVKSLATVMNQDSITVDYGDAEYTYLGRERVLIRSMSASQISSVEDETIGTKIAGTTGLRIKFNRSKGTIDEVETLTFSSDKFNATISANTSIKSSFKAICFKCGLRTYTISFDELTGRHTLE